MVRGEPQTREKLLRDASKNDPTLNACIAKLRAVQSKTTFMSHYVHSLTETEQKCHTILAAEALIKGSREPARVDEDGVSLSRLAKVTMRDARHPCTRHGIYGDEKTIPVDKEVLTKLDQSLKLFVRKAKVVTEGVTNTRRMHRELMIALMESRGAALEERRRLLDVNSRLRKALRTADTTRPNVYLFGQNQVRNSWGVSVAQSSVEAQRGVSPPTPLKGRAEISVQSYRKKKKRRQTPIK